MEEEIQSAYREELQQLEQTAAEIDRQLQILESTPRYYGDDLTEQALENVRESRRRSLDIAQHEPYFGRLDFQEEGQEEPTPLYIGKVRHRDQLYDGEHPEIIDQALWDAVQAKRADGIGTRRERGNSQHSSLLTGMIRDHIDRPMSPSHAVKAKRRYRY